MLLKGGNSLREHNLQYLNLILSLKFSVEIENCEKIRVGLAGLCRLIAVYFSLNLPHLDQDLWWRSGH